MNKFLNNKNTIFLLATIILASCFMLPSVLEAQVEGVELVAEEDSGGGLLSGLLGIGKITGAVVLDVVGGLIGLVMIPVASLIVGLSGVFLNYTIWLTVVKMSDHIRDIDAINIAWSTVRDLANMGFIFILIYASIKTILGMGSDIKGLVVKIVVAAVLINFSLFATKIVIDASNVVAVSFYGAIAPKAVEIDGEFNLKSTGLSNAYTSIINFQTLFKPSKEVNNSNLLAVGVIGPVVLLIAAFSFFVVGLLLIIRFAVLILLMVLSPLAFVAGVFPGVDQYRKQWVDTLLGQSLFAPIYLFLAWVSIYILQSMKSTLGLGDGNTTIDAANAADSGLIGSLILFALVITFMTISVILAKQWASKGASVLNTAVKWASGMAGGATFGMAGRLGRNTVGRVGAAVGDSERLKERASQGGVGGMAARLSLVAGRKTAKQNFDLRGTAIAGGLDAGKAQKGGFEQTLKDKRKKEADFVKSLGPSDTLTTDAERDLEKAKELSTTDEGFLKEHENAQENQRQTVENRQRLLTRLETEGGSTEDIEGARENLQKEEVKLTEIRDIDSYKQSRVKEAQDRVDELKGVNEKEARKRIKEREGWNDKRLDSELSRNESLRSELKDMQIKSTGDRRKSQLTETLANSPTQRAARLAEKPARYVAEGIRSGGEVLGAMAEEATRKAESSGGIVGRIRGMGGRVSERYIRGVTGTVSDVISESPNLIRMKNRAAVAEVRKGKKSVKDRLEEILKEEGEVKEKEGSDDSGGSETPPPGGAPAGGGAPTTL